MPPSPQIESLVADIESTLEPINNRNMELVPAAYLGAVAFASMDSRGMAVACLDSAVAPKYLEFNHDTIRGHYVDLQATTVGKTIRARRSFSALSTMNPEHHVVWGEYFQAGTNSTRNAHGVLQLAYERSLRGNLPISKRTLPTAQEMSQVSDAVTALLRSVPEATLGTELMLDVPVTPNAFVVIWDMHDSTEKVRTSYPEFRKQYANFIEAIKPMLTASGGKVVSNNGDGQNIIIPLPAAVDRNSSYSIANFGHDVVMPLVEHMQGIGIVQGGRTTKFPVGVGLGSIETLPQNGEVTGPVFWDTKECLKAESTSDQGVVYTKEAQLVLTIRPDVMKSGA